MDFMPTYVEIGWKSSFTLAKIGLDDTADTGYSDHILQSPIVFFSFFFEKILFFSREGGEQIFRNMDSDVLDDLSPSDRSDGQRLRRHLQFFFMDPMMKWKVRQQFPFKLALQILKIIFITVQVTFILATIDRKYILACMCVFYVSGNQIPVINGTECKKKVFLWSSNFWELLSILFLFIPDHVFEASFWIFRNYQFSYF